MGPPASVGALKVGVLDVCSKAFAPPEAGRRGPSPLCGAEPCRVAWAVFLGLGVSCSRLCGRILTHLMCSRCAAGSGPGSQRIAPWGAVHSGIWGRGGGGSISCCHLGPSPQYFPCPVLKGSFSVWGQSLSTGVRGSRHGVGGRSVSPQKHFYISTGSTFNGLRLRLLSGEGKKDANVGRL